MWQEPSWLMDEVMTSSCLEPNGGRLISAQARPHLNAAVRPPDPVLEVL